MRRALPARRYAPAVRSAVRLLVVLVVGTALVAACGGDGGGGAEGVDIGDEEFVDLTGRDDVTVDALDNTFSPKYVEVDAGATVTFSNEGRNQHNVFPAEDGAFTPIETADLGPGESASITFEEPGDYPYYCTLHGTKTKGMVGGIRVTG